MRDPFVGYDQWKTASPFDEYGPEICEVCAKDVDDCECPECPVCGEIGNLHCLENHGVDDATVAGSIIKLAENLSVESPWHLYRALYNGSDCGISVGLLLWKNGEMEWIYCDDLPSKGTLAHHRPMGISITGYVEGSDVELPSAVFTEPFDKDTLYEAIKTADVEASYYWDRDNHRNFVIKDAHGNTGWAKIGPNEDFSEKIPEDIKQFIRIFADHVGDATSDPVPLQPFSRGWTIQEYIVDEPF